LNIRDPSQEVDTFQRSDRKKNTLLTVINTNEHV
jgi:hypothetical protein